jgi:hypothetical protein
MIRGVGAGNRCPEPESCKCSDLGKEEKHEIEENEIQNSQFHGEFRSLSVRTHQEDRINEE